MIPSTIVLDRQHRVAAVFLRELLAEDLQPVVAAAGRRARADIRTGAASMSGTAELAATGPLLLALGVCVLAGLVSFASPCVVPLVPGYLSYLAGVVGVDADGRRCRGTVTARRSVADAPAGRRPALLFVAGFTVVFLLGTVAVLGHDHRA